MVQNNKAYFINSPRILSDLIIPHQVECEKYFNIKKQLNLSSTDYDNFVSDMLVEREYISKYAELCKSTKDILDCIFICSRNKNDGILVVPDKNGFIDQAAYIEQNRCDNFNYEHIRTNPRRFQSQRQKSQAATCTNN